MSADAAVAYLAIWFLPGAFFCLHQGIDHWSGKHVPKIVVFDWEVPHWITYTLVFMLGMPLMLALLLDMIRRS